MQRRVSLEQASCPHARALAAAEGGRKARCITWAIHARTACPPLDGDKRLAPALALTDSDASCDAAKSFDDHDGTVTSSCCGLVWQQVVPTQKRTLEDAKAYCAALSLAGGGWRLPTVPELASLVSRGHEQPAIDEAPSAVLWQLGSASPNLGVFDAHVWSVDFLDGMTRSSSTIDASLRYVRCVR
jgi:hypothetical protein